LIGRRTSTLWQAEGRGNFWSDYEGYDLDGNGLGDIAHRIQNVFEYMEGNHPRLRLYLYSPAAQALAAAEKAFPIVRASSESDPAPLMRAVSMEAPPQEAVPQRSNPLPLGAISLTMFGAAATILYRGQH
jgi:nitrous oxidase accessory protein